MKDDEILHRLDDISAKLSVLVALAVRRLGREDTGLSQRGNRRGVGETIRYLSDLGLGPEEIAKVTNSPISSVRTLLTPGRRRK